MANLRLTFACGPFDRTQALRDGTIRPDGIDLVYLSLQPASRRVAVEELFAAGTLRDIPLSEDSWSESPSSRDRRIIAGVRGSG
jgi:hypothetical protein